MDLVYMDLETYSETPIKYGTHKYAENCEILLWGYAIDDEPAKVWDCTLSRDLIEDMPWDLKRAIEAIQRKEARCVWHNGMNFDTVVLEAKGIHIPVEQIIDTMVLAYQHGLPGALGDLCDVMRMPKDVAKDKDGKRLVQIFCKPLPSNYKLHRATRITHADDWKRFVNYCRLDVEAERALYKKLPTWNAKRDHKFQIIDAKINRRGMLMDIPLAKAAVEMSIRNREKLAAETRLRTNGEVGSATQRDALIAYIEKVYGIKLESMTKAELEKRCADPDLPEPMRELLRLRLMSTKTSIQKFQSIINCTCANDRLRGCLQFRGAARTGRFSGRLFQPQNLARPSMKNEEIDFAIESLKDGTFDLWFDNPSEVLPNLLRGEIIAPEGKKLVVADYSNVEGRVLAWLSGEDWKVKAFREFDAGHGHDLYKLTYGRTFNVSPESVTKAQRQMGKVLELALGYGGGAGAFVTFARGYGIDLHDMASAVREAIDPTIWAEAEQSYDFFVEKKLTAGLERDVFLACDAVKRAWRLANPHIVGFWNAVDEALEEAMTSPLIAHAGEHVCMKRRGNYLLVRLPSGRFLCYPSPRIGKAGSDDDRFSYMGVQQFTRKWTRIRSYASKVCIAEGTLVLTDSGAKPIETVTAEDMVWDGEEWVSQHGSVCNGEKDVIQVYGVWMTPDHKVLTTEGWRNASETKGLDRQEVGLPDGIGLREVERQNEAMECTVRGVRADGCYSGKPSSPVRSEGEPCLLRMQKEAKHFREAKETRSIENTSLDGMAFDERAVRNIDCTSLEELRRPGYTRLPRVERIIRGISKGHGSDVPQGTYVRQDKRGRGLLPGELPVGYVQRTGQQQAKDAVYRREAFELLGSKNGYRSNNASVSTGSWVPQRASVRQAGHKTKVFDLVNCGPRHRFVARGNDGWVIVHNCENITQAVSCDLLCEALVRLEENGFETVLTVHDEAITEAPDTPDFSLKKMAALMAELPDWAKGLPLAAAGFEGYRYRKD